METIVPFVQQASSFALSPVFLAWLCYPAKDSFRASGFVCSDLLRAMTLGESDAIERRSERPRDGVRCCFAYRCFWCDGAGERSARPALGQEGPADQQR